MLKKIIIVATCLLSFSAFANSPVTPSACAQALPTDNAGFCASFIASAKCHCMEHLPGGMCQNVTAIYNRMIGMFGSQQKACEYQKDASVQVCNDDWNCYRLGGRNSQGKLCSGTGKACG